MSELERETAYYSALERAIAEAPMQAAKLSGWQDYLRRTVNQGKVKEEELKWTDFLSRLEAAATQAENGKLDRDTVRELAEASAVRLYIKENGSTPEWVVQTVSGEEIYYTEAEAEEAYELSMRWIDDEMVVIAADMHEGTITVKSYEEGYGTSNPEDYAEITEVFTRETRWNIDGKYLNKDDTITFLEEEVAEFDRKYPDNAPHYYIFNSGSEDAVIESENGAELDSYYAHTDCWCDLEGSIYYGYEAAYREARYEAESLRENAYSNISAPELQDNHETKYRGYSFADNEPYRYREVLLILGQSTGLSPEVRYTSSHWSHENVIAHIRLTDFGKTLFVEELQSDWGQDIRRDKTLVPTNVPFVGNTNKWLTLALKKVLHEATTGDYQRIAFINGFQSMKRYSLGEYIDTINLTFDPNHSSYLLNAYDKDGRFIVIPEYDADGRKRIAPEKLEETLERYIGKELSERLLQKEKEPHYYHGGYRQSLKGADLHVQNATGMRKFYDEVVPNMLRPLLKKLDPAIEIQTVHQEETGSEQLCIDVTNTLREKVRAGQTLFSFGPASDLSDLSALAVNKTAASLPQYQQTQALLAERLGARAARLITLTDCLPDGTPLLHAGAHTRDDGQTYINPARIAPLHDRSGKEILSRDEHVLWVAHHELFHRGVSVRGVRKLTHALRQADSNSFVHMLADAISVERSLHAPETAPRRREEAVEEALAEIYAARQSGHMEALRERYRAYAPGLELPQTHDGWRGKLQEYADGVRGVLYRLTRREVSMTDMQVVGLLGRVGAAATRELSSQQATAADGSTQQPRPDFSSCASPRDAGKLAWEFIGGDMSRLPEAIRALSEQGYRVDARRLHSVPAHPLMQREALMKAVFLVPQTPQKIAQAER